VLDGVVDCIAAHHFPHEFDSKVIEFEYARPGMTSLETVYAVLRTQLPELPAERVVDLLSRNPRTLFHLDQPSIAEGQPASLSIFDPEGQTLLTAGTTRSKSKNSPFFGKELKGRVIGILKGDQLILN